MPSQVSIFSHCQQTSGNQQPAAVPSMGWVTRTALPHLQAVSWLGDRSLCIKLKLQRELSTKQNVLSSAEHKPNRRRRALQAWTIRGSCCPSWGRPQHHQRASRTLATFICSGNIPAPKTGKVSLWSQILLSPMYLNLHIQEKDAGIWEFSTGREKVFWSLALLDSDIERQLQIPVKQHNSYRNLSY